jgi:CBS domain-containing protein
MTAIPDILAFLKRNAPFSLLDDDDIAWLASRLTPETVEAGCVLLQPGEKPEALIFVTEGSIRIEAVGEAIPEERRLIAEIVPGECFPVEALHEVRPVFSTYRANEALRIIKLSAADFAELKARSGLFLQYCNDRADAFLGSSRRIFEAHFGRRADNAISLEAPLSSLRLRLPDTCLPETPVLMAAEQLSNSGELAIIVVDAGNHPIGVFTLHDLVKRVLLAGGDVAQPISAVMTRNIVTLPLESNGYEAAQAMAEHGLRQILVVDRGELKGAISERDLFAAQHMSLGQLSARIRRADSVEGLAVLAGENWTLAKRLMEQGIAAEPLTRIISSLNDRLTDRILEICRSQESQPLPDFCWIALGSEGRHEQTLSTDQDNGIIFADQENTEAVRERLLAFARRVNAGLNACGFPLCKGNIMAGNPQWCLSLSEWKKQFSSWIDRPGPEAILNATIFFDLRPLYGNHDLARQLSEWLVKALSDQSRFFHNLSGEALKRSPPLGLFRDFVVDQDANHPSTIDMKLNGVTLFVDAARILGLRTGCTTSQTSERLRHAAKAMRIDPTETESWIDAFHFIQMLRLRNQYDCSEAGEKPHNRLNPYKLNELDRKVLIESLRQAKRLQKRLETIQGQ